MIPLSGNNPRVYNPFLGERSTVQKGQEHLIVLKELLLCKEFAPHDPFQKREETSCLSWKFSFYWRNKNRTPSYKCMTRNPDLR